MLIHCIREPTVERWATASVRRGFLTAQWDNAADEDVHRAQDIMGFGGPSFMVGFKKDNKIGRIASLRSDRCPTW